MEVVDEECIYRMNQKISFLCGTMGRLLHKVVSGYDFGRSIGGTRNWTELGWRGVKNV